ncbi:MAG TPA: hypothetical protein PK335_12245 [Draconibacterium sp.]|nr:hypothetical protein [Draconibacterium sp.]
MKTKNNVQKAITKSLAVIISLVLLSFTVNAQEFWKSVLKNNSFTQIAMAMSNETSGPSHHEVYNTSSMALFSEMFRTEAEPALTLDDWMMDDARFTGVSGMFQPEAETSLELEDWMMNERNFGVRTFIILEEQEAALQLENWMVDSKVWKM